MKTSQQKDRPVQGSIQENHKLGGISYLEQKSSFSEKITKLVFVSEKIEELLKYIYTIFYLHMVTNACNSVQLIFKHNCQISKH